MMMRRRGRRGRNEDLMMDDLSADSDSDEEKIICAKTKKLDKRAQTIIEAFKNLEKRKKEWLKFQAKEQQNLMMK